MKIAPVADVKARLSTYLELCAEQPVVVTKNGRPTALLVGVVDENDLERLMLAHTPRFKSILDAAERRIAKGRGIQPDEFWARLSKPSRAASESRGARVRPRAASKSGKIRRRVGSKPTARERRPHA